MAYRKSYGKLLEQLKERYSAILSNVVNTLQQDGINVDKRKIEEQLDREFKEIERLIQRETGSALSKAYEDGLAENYVGMYNGMTLAESEQLVTENLMFFNVGTEDDARYVRSQNSLQRLQKIAERRWQEKGMSLEQARELVRGESSSDMRALRLMAETFEDVLSATHNTNAGIKEVVREYVKDVTQYHAYKTFGSYEEQAEELAERLTKAGLSERVTEDGFVGIVDKAGKRWNIDTYSEMVIKTKTNDAYMEGIRTGTNDLGMDLAIISDHGAEDECAWWENVVISMNGLTPGFPTYDEAKGTNEVFHPNCQHTVHIIRDVSMLPEDLQREHAEKLGNLGEYTERIKK